MEYTKDILRKWLIEHEYMISFSEKNYISRTIKATRVEWNDFYRLLSQSEDLYEACKYFNDCYEITWQVVEKMQGLVEKAIAKAET